MPQRRLTGSIEPGEFRPIFATATLLYPSREIAFPLKACGDLRALGFPPDQSAFFFTAGRARKDYFKARGQKRSTRTMAQTIPQPTQVMLG